ncbi:MAG: hypothetical protein QMD03_07680 [Syntrophales bacterium]|nr:hypothetical protein [Syntrophales bacterium]
MIFGQSVGLSFKSAFFLKRGMGRKYIVGRTLYWAMGYGLWALASCLLPLVSCPLSLAGETGTYQVVPGNDDNAYLVDTTTGAVWILTYRALATGREPVAIPYKFIKLSPKNYKDFLVEDIPGAPINIKERDK